MAKVYITKYAISRGIEEIEREIYEVRDYDYSYIRYNFYTFLYISNKHLLSDEHLNNILKLKENQHYCKTNPNKL